MSGILLASVGNTYASIPVNTVAPVVSGTPTVGQTLSTTNGTWTGAPPPTFTYQWQRNSVNISGATSSTYLLVAADIGNPIRCVVTATNPSGVVSANSNQTANVSGLGPVNTVAPVVSGTATVGQTLSTTDGTWTGTPAPTFTYQWQRNSVNISGATNNTYLLVAADIGNPIRCVVTGTNSAGSNSANSNQTANVAGIAPVNTVAPVVSGTATVGQTLSTTNGTWTGTPTPTFTYQWQRNSVNISGATSSTYTLVAADYNNPIRCVVTGTNAAGSASANSNATANVAGLAPVNTVTPTISGTAAAGSTLTVSAGTWTGVPTPTFGYQWQRGTSNISGATSTTYVVQLADVGSTIRCVVTGTNAVGSASANTANTSSVTVPAMGAPVAGGYYAGQISTSANSVPTHYLIVAPKSSGQQSSIAWKTTDTSTSGADSVIDGPANTAAMNDAVYPAAQFCIGVSAGGFNDWYMPAKNELDVCYSNLKPTTDNNSVTLNPSNTNAVPSRTGEYTTTVPGQTSSADFQSPSGSERFDTGANAGSIVYWSSTKAGRVADVDIAWIQSFFNSVQIQNFVIDDDSYLRVRAIRRVAV